MFLTLLKAYNDAKICILIFGATLMVIKHKNTIPQFL